MDTNQDMEGLVLYNLENPIENQDIKSQDMKKPAYRNKPGQGTST